MRAFFTPVSIFRNNPQCMISKRRASQLALPLPMRGDKNFVQFDASKTQLFSLTHIKTQQSESNRNEWSHIEEHCVARSSWDVFRPRLVLSQIFFGYSTIRRKENRKLSSVLGYNRFSMDVSPSTPNTGIFKSRINRFRFSFFRYPPYINFQVYISWCSETFKRK